MHRQITSVAACVLVTAFAVLSPSPAQVLPSLPPRPDFVASLPAGQWVFAKLLWQGRAPCTKELCQAGYYAPPLMLSVNFSKNSDNDLHSIEAVAAIRGCDSLASNLMWEADYGKLDLEARYQYVASRVQTLAAAIGRACKVNNIPAIPTAELRRLVKMPVE